MLFANNNFRAKAAFQHECSLALGVLVTTSGEARVAYHNGSVTGCGALLLSGKLPSGA
jgi:hypothetical protein